MENTQVNCNKYVKINKEILSTQKKKKKNLNTIVDNRNDSRSVGGLRTE